MSASPKWSSWTGKGEVPVPCREREGERERGREEREREREGERERRKGGEREVVIFQSSICHVLPFVGFTLLHKVVIASSLKVSLSRL